MTPDQPIPTDPALKPWRGKMVPGNYPDRPFAPYVHAISTPSSANCTVIPDNASVSDEQIDAMSEAFSKYEPKPEDGPAAYRARWRAALAVIKEGAL
jgi:hypothetical protein